MHDLPDDHDINHLRGALSLLKERGCDFGSAVDCGAHRGIWSRELNKHFDFVYAFEPCEENRANFKCENGVCLYPWALGATTSLVSLAPGKDNTGQWHINPGVRGDVTMVTLDSTLICRADFLKIDAEGYELYVLRGAEKLITDNQPAIMVELNRLSERYNHTDQDVIDWLEERGYKQEGRWNKDYLFVWSGKE